MNSKIIFATLASIALSAVNAKAGMNPAADKAVDPVAAEYAPNVLKSGEYYRERYECMLVMAQDEDKIYQQVFTTPGSLQNCQQNGTSVVYKHVPGTRNAYRAADNDYLKVIGDSAVLLSNSYELLKKDLGNLYVIRHR